VIFQAKVRSHCFDQPLQLSRLPLSNQSSSLRRPPGHQIQADLDIEIGRAPKLALLGVRCR